jgi:ubiquinone biosynthesis protein
MLTSSLLLGSSIMLAFKVPPLLFTNGFWGLKDLSLLGLAGLVTSLLVSFRLVLAINNSGHLDPASEQQEEL